MMYRLRSFYNNGLTRVKTMDDPEFIFRIAQLWTGVFVDLS
ncbi:hypothetical protein [Spirosoma horti]